MTNITQTLSSLFEEMMGGEENRSDVSVAKLMTALKKPNNDTFDFGTLVKLVDGWRTKLNLSKTDCDYCDGFRDVVLAYNGIHGYVSLIICLFGSLANALNVAVLTRRDLAAAPINRLLKWLAVADIFVMMEYVPFAVYKYMILPGQREMPYRWAAYLLFHMHFAQVFHTASICLTLSLAIWRYIAIKYSDRSHVLCTERRCSTAILSSFFIPPVLCIPTYLVFDVHTAIVWEQNRPIVLYHVDSDDEGHLYQINFWVHAVVIKLLPCCILTLISLWLIKEVYSANEHQKKIRVYNACPINDKAQKRKCKGDKRTNRTTKMLVAVLLLFLVTELPQGILGLMSGLLGRCFFKRCYNLFGEIMDALALMNGAINFVLYCCMSRQFRLTFRHLLWRAKIQRWPPPQPSHSDGLHTAKTSVP
ncbi:G-protein coupled receptor dmsr-1-like [Aricia agestis]|uniref:G-protein coupled receptor dmsr-1-like n=1 Tax=Aricia agestis TaxID=91739 RepID=UPI001C207B2A|nr:G-protein coupled receptor dmsr-1-like [Aricia agestis]